MSRFPSWRSQWNGIIMENQLDKPVMVPVWDWFVRAFHWSTVLGFAAAWLTGTYGANEIHILLGYGITLLLLARLVWGLIGTPYARFSALRISATEVLRYLRSLRSGSPLHYLGHNPLGGLMVCALLLMLLALSASGLVILGAIEFEGPLLAFTQILDDKQAYAVRELHEALAWLALLLVALHVAGAISASIQHHENLVLAMITGRKRLPPAQDSTTTAPERSNQ